MNLYLISQNVNNGYDTYDSAVVCANSENEARKISPDKYYTWCDKNEYWARYHEYGKELQAHHYRWVDDISHIKVKLIGKANKDVQHGVVLESFNAG